MLFMRLLRGKNTKFITYGMIEKLWAGCQSNSLTLDKFPEMGAGEKSWWSTGTVCATESSGFVLGHQWLGIAHCSSFSIVHLAYWGSFACQIDNQGVGRRELRLSSNQESSSHDEREGLWKGLYFSSGAWNKRHEGTIYCSAVNRGNLARCLLKEHGSCVVSLSKGLCVSFSLLDLSSSGYVCLCLSLPLSCLPCLPSPTFLFPSFFFPLSPLPCPPLSLLKETQISRR